MNLCAALKWCLFFILFFLKMMCVSSLFFYYFCYLFIYVAVPGLRGGMQGLFFKLWHVESSSLTRDRSPVPCTGRVLILSHWTAREVPKMVFIVRTRGMIDPGLDPGPEKGHWGTTAKI